MPTCWAPCPVKRKATRGRAAPVGRSPTPRTRPSKEPQASASAPRSGAHRRRCAMRAAGVGGEAQVGQVQAGRSRGLRVAPRQLSQLAFVARRQGQQVRGALVRGGLGRPAPRARPPAPWALVPLKPGADARDRRLDGCPGRHGGGHRQRPGGPVDVRVALAEVQVRRQPPRAGPAPPWRRRPGRPRPQVADVGLDGTDEQGPRGLAARADTAPRAPTSIRSPSGVPVPCLDVADLAAARVGQRGADHVFLRRAIGRGQAAARPSWLMALPRTTASTRSRRPARPTGAAAPAPRSLRRARSRRRRRRGLLQRPSAAIIRAFEVDVHLGREHQVHRAGRCHSPRRRPWTARCRATGRRTGRDTVTAGPCAPST